jgi:hypothetical protein
MVFTGGRMHSKGRTCMIELHFAKTKEEELV